MKRSSTNFIQMLKRRKNLWMDSDSEESTTDHPTLRRSSSKENDPVESISKSCCLICSILASLTEENCCSKHLNLLHKRQVQSMFPLIHRSPKPQSLRRLGSSSLSKKRHPLITPAAERICHSTIEFIPKPMETNDPSLSPSTE